MAVARHDPVGVGIIGAGTISDTYLQNLTSFPDTEVLAIGDLLPEAAQGKAEKYAVPAYGGVDAVLANPDVEVVVNLTIPAAHAEVASRALGAGKHVWNEKPLALDRSSGTALLDQARAAGLRIGAAPDTFLGSGLQESRRRIDRGDIGTPLSALVLLQSPGPESWHPNPAFLFAAGAGPLFDIGPYYLTALGQIFGPIEAVAATGSKARESRVIGSGPRAGEVFPVLAPTHVSVLARYRSGQSANLIFSFDSALARTTLEVNGSEGAMILPDPNRFEGDIVIHRQDREPEVVATQKRSTRGTGVLDLARAARTGGPHRASGELAFHILDVMTSVEEAVDSAAYVQVASSFEVPALLPDDWDAHAATI
jgi:predicted dehydrogenase